MMAPNISWVGEVEKWREVANTLWGGIFVFSFEAWGRHMLGISLLQGNTVTVAHWRGRFMRSQAC
jgi:hypothetical protein